MRISFWAALVAALLLASLALAFDSRAAFASPAPDNRVPLAEVRQDNAHALGLPADSALETLELRVLLLTLREQLGLGQQAGWIEIEAALPRYARQRLIEVIGRTDDGVTETFLLIYEAGRLVRARGLQLHDKSSLQEITVADLKRLPRKNLAEAMASFRQDFWKTLVEGLLRTPSPSLVCNLGRRCT